MKKQSNIIALITFLAGFIFLIYEVSWNRHLALILGTSVKASTIILSSFMAGFGLGAIAIGKKAQKISANYKLLSALFLGLAVINSLNYSIITNLPTTLTKLNLSLITTDILLHSTVVILLAIPAFIMGGVIPVISKIIINNNSEIAVKLGKIYALETLGSTVGGLTTGFILLKYLGQFQTTISVSVLSLLIAVYAFFAKQKTSSNASSNTSQIKPQIKSQLKSKSNLHNSKNGKSQGKQIASNNDLSARQTAKLATFIIGFAMLAMQILWIRVMRTYFPNTSYSFAIIAGSVIVAYYIGSKIFERKIEVFKDHKKLIIRILILFSIAIAIGLPLLVYFPELFMFPFMQMGGNHFFRLLVIPAIASALIIIPPGILSGFAFPLACKMNSDKAQDISQSLGNTMMINTIGAALGPLVSAFILIPVFGIGKSILVLLILLISSTIFILKKFLKEEKSSFTVGSLIGTNLILLVSIIAVKEIQFLPPSVKKLDKKIIEYDETREGTIIISQEKNKGVFGKTTFINNSAVIGSNFESIKAVKMIGHLPFFSNLKCENALVIGFGIGVTTSAIASHPEVQNIDCVEMIPGLMKTAYHYSDFNNNVQNSTKINAITQDGRYYLQTTNKKYDLISCDPTHPVLGSGNLYTKEYFEQCLAHLTPNGMVSQYLPIHKLRQEDLLGIIKTFNSVFPNTWLWIGQYHAILMASKSTDKIDFGTWKSKIAQMPKDDFFYFEPYNLATAIIYDKAMMSQVTKDMQINTDDKSYTEFFNFNCFDAENLSGNFKYLQQTKILPDKVFVNISDRARLMRFVAGNDKMARSIYWMLQKNNQNAFLLMQEAVALNPENLENRFLLKLYYGNKK